MKKKNLKSLNLNKKVVSKLKKQEQSHIKGGSIMLGCGTMFDSCQVCPPEETEFVCSSWWGGQLCKPCDE